MEQEQEERHRAHALLTEPHRCPERDHLLVPLLPQGLCTSFCLGSLSPGLGLAGSLSALTFEGTSLLQTGLSRSPNFKEQPPFPHYSFLLCSFSRHISSSESIFSIYFVASSIPSLVGSDRCAFSLLFLALGTVPVCRACGYMLGCINKCIN